MTNYLKKSLISVFLAMCLLAVSVPISTASALKEDIDIPESVSVDSTYFEDPALVESEPLDANDISEYEQIEKIDENAQSVPASAESGSDTYNINSGNVVIDIEEGDTCQLVATNPYNLSFTWTTTDFEVASVSSQGVLTAHKSGKVTVTASFMQCGGTYKTQCTVYVYIDVGAFYIKNLSSGYYLHVDNGKINSLTNVYQYSKYSDSTTDAYKTRQIWRLHYLGSGRYSLRPLHKLDMALDVTGTNADIFKIGSVDTLASVPSFAEWEISWHINGYVLTNNGSADKALQVEGGSTALAANINVDTYSYTARHRWVLERISNPPKGVLMYNTQTGYYITSATKTIVLGETKTLSNLNLTAVSYQTVTPGNLVRWSSSNTAIATVNTSSGAITANSCGKATITASANGKSTSYTLWVIPIHDGTYFLKNRKTDKYADIEDQIMSNGTQIHQWEFHGGSTQQWTFTHLGDGYYSIKSANSSTPYYLGVSGDSTDNNAPIVLRNGTLTDGMKWKITVTASGAYKITPKTGEANNRVLSVGWYALNINGIDIEQRDYVNDSDYKDEWVLRAYTNTIQLEAQQQGNWCWAASARMSSNNYMISPVSQASAAVYVKLGIVTDSPTSAQITSANEGGTVGETEKALEYILTSDNVYSVWGKIYSESNLRKMLDNNNPVIILRGWYDSANNRTGGHYVIIYDYHWDSTNNIYLYDIFDPWNVNVGSSYSRSYRSICNGRNSAFAADMTDTGRWEGIVVYKKGVYQETISWPSP